MSDETAPLLSPENNGSAPKLNGYDATSNNGVTQPSTANDQSGGESGNGDVQDDKSFKTLTFMVSSTLRRVFVRRVLEKWPGPLLSCACGQLSVCFDAYTNPTLLRLSRLGVSRIYVITLADSFIHVVHAYAHRYLPRSYGCHNSRVVLRIHRQRTETAAKHKLDSHGIHAYLGQLPVRCLYPSLPGILALTRAF